MPGNSQLTVRVTSIERPRITKSLRRLRAKAQSGPGPNSARPAIGSAEPTISAAMVLSPQPPAPAFGSIAAGHALADGDEQTAVTAAAGQPGVVAVVGEAQAAAPVAQSGDVLADGDGGAWDTGDGRGLTAVYENWALQPWAHVFPLNRYTTTPITYLPAFT